MSSFNGISALEQNVCHLNFNTDFFFQHQISSTQCLSKSDEIIIVLGNIP